MDEKEMQDIKKAHRKKMVAPIVVCVLLVLYYLFFAVLCMCISIPVIFKVLLILIPLALAGVMLFVCLERMKEIRSGEEDDLSKY